LKISEIEVPQVSICQHGDRKLILD